MQLNGETASSMHAALTPSKTVNLPLPSDMAYTLAAAEWADSIKPTLAVAKQSASRRVPVRRQTAAVVRGGRQLASNRAKSTVSMQRAAPSSAKVSEKKRRNAQSRRPIAEL
jgi:hypothetical protein